VIDLDGDLSQMIEGAFSEPVEIIFGGLPSGDGPITVRGLFDRTYQQVDMDTGALVASRTSMVSLREKTVIDALAAVGYNDEPFQDEDQIWMVKVAGLGFRVTRAEYDGKGIIMLVLKRADLPAPPAEAGFFLTSDGKFFQLADGKLLKVA
jgi:hypothetical protein